MAQTIGAAGWQPYPADFEIQSTTYDNCGRVIALTKNITTHDLVYETATNSQEPFARLFVNSCLWAARQHASYPSVYLFSTGNTALDEAITSLLIDCNMTVTNIGPWHSHWNNSSIPKNAVSFFNCFDIPSPELYILIPNYNALGALSTNDRRMDYQLQTRVFTDVTNKKSGLLIGEWFHFLHSQPNRQTFYNATDPSQSLYLLSPFDIPNSTPSITNEDSLVIVDTEKAYFNRVLIDDTMSRVLPASFEIEMSNATHTPYNAEYTNIYDAKPSVTIFWTTDTVDTVVVDPTPPPPLPEPVELNEIHMKVAEVLLPESCGPLNLRLDGLYENYFRLEGTSIYLLREPEDKIKIPITVIAEDHFVPARFAPIVETYIANFDKCDANITLPLDGSGPAFSFRKCPYPKMWGSNNDDNVSIVPFSDWSFSGEGSVEFPAIATLGGQHCDINILWLQVNVGGSLYIEIQSDTELRPNNSCGTSISPDYGYYYIIKNTTDSNVTPEQHDNFITTFFSNGVSTPYYYVDFNSTPWSGKLSSSQTISIPNPNEQDQNGDRVRGDVYIALVFNKGNYKSEYTDKIRLVAYFGDIATTPPPEVDVNIVANNLLENTILSGFNDSAAFNEFISETRTGTAGTNISPNPETFTISAQNGLHISDLDINHNNSTVISNISWTPMTPNTSNKTIYVYYKDGKFPLSDQSVTIDISGTTVTTTTTTTTTCPPCDLTLDLINDINNVRLVYEGVSYRKGDANLQIVFDVCATTANTSKTVNYFTDNNYVYYNNDKPNEIYVSGEGLTFAIIRISNNSGYINITWSHLDCDENIDYASTYRLENDPVTTTTTTTTTQSPFCDDEINILCEQTLYCAPDPTNPSQCIPTLSLSSQRLIAVTCCDMTNDEILARVFEFFGQSYTSGVSTLEDIQALVDECSSSVTEAFGDCAAKDSEGNCNETVLTRTVPINHNGQTIIYCTAAGENPLP